MLSSSTPGIFFTSEFSNRLHLNLLREIRGWSQYGSDFLNYYEFFNDRMLFSLWGSPLERLEDLPPALRGDYFEFFWSWLFWRWVRIFWPVGVPSIFENYLDFKAKFAAQVALSLKSSVTVPTLYSQLLSKGLDFVSPLVFNIFLFKVT